MALNPDDLNVESFPSDGTRSISTGGVCTGCASGCGYFPDNVGSESGSDGGYCTETIVIMA